MKINIVSPSTSSINTNRDGANVQGDEIIARSWLKYLNNDSRVDCVTINGSDNIKYDISLSFSPLLPSTNGYQILYLQNIFPKPAWPGTIEMFHSVKHNYNAFIFPSPGLQKMCGDGLVCQFAVDSDIFYPTNTSDELMHNCCFVGNNIRDKETTEKYILCAKNKGLVIYGNLDGWQHPNCFGKISIEKERLLYSSSKICLNAHLNEHLIYGSFNFRIFNILACKGFIISDRSKFLEDEFKDCIEFTDGYTDLLDKIDYYVTNPDKTVQYRENGYNKVLQNHTFKHRVDDFLSWVGEKL